MALSITAANVLAAANSRVTWGTAGATITAGMPLYADASASNKLKGARTDISAALAEVVGIALAGASNDQPLPYLAADGALINLGATLATGKIYGLGQAAGRVQDINDCVSGEYISTIGVAISTSQLKVSIKNSGVQLA